MKHATAGIDTPMYIGTSIFLIALGAILKYAVTFTVAGVSIQTVGLILMIVGVVGLVASFLYPLADRRRHDRGPRSVGPVTRDREY